MVNKHRNTILFLAIPLLVLAGCQTGKKGQQSSEGNSFSSVQAAQKISFAFETLQLEQFETKVVLASVTPSESKVSYSSSNTNVATISPTGKILAKSVGNTSIKANTSFGEASFVLEVVAPKENKPLNCKKNVYLSLDGKLQEARLGLEGTYEYSLMDEAVAKIDNTGKITPVAKGETDLLIKGEGGIALTHIKVADIALTNPSDWLEMLNAHSIKAKTNPETGVAYDSNDPRGYLTRQEILSAKKSYVLAKDLDFTGTPYLYKSDFSTDCNRGAFWSDIDGAGHTVKNVKFDASMTRQALFPVLLNATVENLAFEKITYNGADINGGLAVTILSHHNDLQPDGKSALSTYSTIVRNVSLNLTFSSQYAYGLAPYYYGGRFSNVFIQMKQKDDLPFLGKSAGLFGDDWLWGFPASASNCIAYVNNESELPDVAAENYGGQHLLRDNVVSSTSKMECLYAAQSFPSEYWSVSGDHFPLLKQQG